jgi:streptogramin lyase
MDNLLMDQDDPEKRIADPDGTTPDGAPPPDAGTTAPPGFRPARRPGPKLWIFAIVFAFGIIPLIWVIAHGVMSRDQQKANRLTADRERQFALPFTDLRLPHGVAVDAAGNVYVADSHTNRVLKLAAGSNTQTVLPFTGLDLCGDTINESTGSVAVDAAGNVYVTDTCHNKVLKLAPGSNTQTLLPFSGVDFPEGVAVDTAGTVYVADRNHGRVVKLAAGSSNQSVLPSIRKWGTPDDVAVDTTGAVYIGINGKHTYLLRLAPGSDTWTQLPSPGHQQFVAVDAAGNVYVVRSGDTGGVVKLAPGSSDWTELPGEHRFVDPQGLAVDTRGNVYVTDHTGDRAQAFFFKWAVTEDNAQGFAVRLPAG